MLTRNVTPKTQTIRGTANAKNIQKREAPGKKSPFMLRIPYAKDNGQNNMSSNVRILTLFTSCKERLASFKACRFPRILVRPVNEDIKSSDLAFMPRRFLCMT